MTGDVVVAVLVMALATAATRLAGLMVPARWTEQGRLGAAFRALPVAVLTAVVAPTALVTGWHESVAALVAVVAALRLPLVVTVVLGVATVVLLRAFA